MSGNVVSLARFNKSSAPLVVSYNDDEKEALNALFTAGQNYGALRDFRYLTVPGRHIFQMISGIWAGAPNIILSKNVDGGEIFHQYSLTGQETQIFADFMLALGAAQFDIQNLGAETISENERQAENARARAVRAKFHIVREMP